MDSPRSLDGHGVVLPGSYPNRAEARSAALDYLLANGVDEWEAESQTGGRVDRAWWAGPDVGFCAEGHPDAQLVTVVHP